MYPVTFPRNQWYVAGHSADLGSDLLSRWILGEPLCLYRKHDGLPVAVADQCVHRQMPLSLGRRKGDSIECRYHGILYTDDGAAARIPSQANIPANCQVKRYPIVDRGGFAWIWMGDQALADESLIPSHSWLDSPDWTVVRGTLHMNARAQLLNENLLDLSHVSYLHADTIGSEEIAEGAASTEVDGRTVRVTRVMPAMQCPPLFRRVMGLNGQIDRESVAEFVAPGFHVSYVLARPAGAGPSSPETCRHNAVHGITPERTNSAHYFWAVARDYRIDDAEVSRIWQEGAPRVLTQDVDAVEAIEKIISAYEPGYPVEINLKADAGGLRARRIIEQMIVAEQSGLPSGFAR
jgi:phenylpropionate dioxygenase-like ring-hydroxylating dioxygenase large terminal subunit